METGTGRQPDAASGAGDALLGRVLAGLLEASHQAAPWEVSALVGDAGRALGLGEARVFLADVQQVLLVPMPGPEQPVAGESPGQPPPTSPGPPPEAGRPAAGSAGGDTGDPETGLDVDTTLAGRAYRTETLLRAAGTPPVCWVPLIDGIERIGVLRVHPTGNDSALVEGRARALASLVTLILVSKSTFSDAIVRTTRTRPMSLQAELLWAFVPPRTIGTRSVTSSAVLEPAYEVAGDAFDHSLAGDVLHVILVDAMGHDLASGGASAVALAACRSTRRTGGSLADIATAIDEALNEWIPDRLLTTVLTDLDTGTGRLSWVNCGHPPPLLIRSGAVVPGALERRPHPPLGIGRHLGRHPGRHLGPPEVHRVRLEPGDRVLLHTDGVTEARSVTGDLFGEHRLLDHIVRLANTDQSAPEALRRLMHALLVHQDHRLRDDATAVLIDWHPPQ
ncbi:PP2C family protein-serine/threonine phosphatase [Kitasatospora sp. NPDC088346]|uniref:PP2C family protein-serine/threonine phosphatase n=1 Tax=Kitasatospora sp. NPDC088346 TaxID=3364073 RepID=UPI00382D7E0E